MRISTHEDIEAPIAHVFAMVTDFDTFERQALRRGAEVSREDAGQAPGVGSEWQARFKFRGKRRDLTAKLTRFDPPKGFSAEWVVSGLAGTFTVELVALSPRRTRLQVAYEMTPRTLTARLLLQSLRLARGRLTERLSKRVYEYAQTIQDRYRAGA